MTGCFISCNLLKLLFIPYVHYITELKGVNNINCVAS